VHRYSRETATNPVNRQPRQAKAKQLLLLAMVWMATAGMAGARETVAFDSDWRFSRSDPAGAEQSGFEDSNWRTLDVPHDWSIAGPFSPTNTTGGAGGFLPSGVSWYRKKFTLSEAAATQCVFIEFDGVMANSTVWINGHRLGHRPYGYVSFRYELTPHLKFGDSATNTVAVRTDTSEQPASRWYTGAGIYRHVRLVRTAPVHIAADGIFVWTPEVFDGMATVRVNTTVTNQSDATRQIVLRTAIMNPNHREVGSVQSTVTITNGSSVTIPCELGVSNPLLWDIDTPRLYQLRTRILATKPGRAQEGLGLEPLESTLDEVITPFGIRDARFTAEEGFELNGRKVRLQGVCLHHGGGAVGAAVPLSIWEQRLTTLKEFGCNAIRTAHNPVAPEFLDLCDRMGFLVMDEFFDCWTVGKNPYDYHLYFEEWSLRDPSVILYSVGNEIHDTSKPALARRILAGLVEECHLNDPTRPVTQALFRPNTSGDYTNGLADLLDVVGTNYRDQELLDAQRAHPDWKIVGTEQQHNLQTWLLCRDHPSHSGQFLWTGIDYLGEARHWPRNAFASGLLDRTALPKPRAFQRQSWWTDAPMVHVVRRIRAEDVLPEDPGYGGEERFTQVTFADWTPRDLEPHEENVEVYSNCEEVELVLNGRSLGSLPKPKDDAPRRWTIPFEPGHIKAIARNAAGQVVAVHELQTAGKPARIQLVADRHHLNCAWDNVVVVRATVTDAHGVRIPRAADRVSFKVDGPGRIVAVDNGDCMSTEPFQATERRAYGGTCVAILRGTAPGQVSVTASAAGLESDEVSFEVNPAAE